MGVSGFLAILFVCACVAYRWHAGQDEVANKLAERQTKTEAAAEWTPVIAEPTGPLPPMPERRKTPREPQ